MITLILLPMAMVYSYPVNMICVPGCYLNMTANAEFVNEWLHHNSTGLHQLRNHKGTLVNDLLDYTSTDVS